MWTQAQRDNWNTMRAGLPQGELFTTYNDGISADTFNSSTCAARSRWCVKHCYGNKLAGLGACAAMRQNPGSWARMSETGTTMGKTARGKGYGRPFTVRGDIPWKRSDFVGFSALIGAWARSYSKVWIPTRTWRLKTSKESGLDRLDLLLEAVPNLVIGLSWDPTMDRAEWSAACTWLHGRHPGRVHGSVVYGCPDYTETERQEVSEVMGAGVFRCHKTVKVRGTGKAGTCQRTCKRACWGDRKGLRTNGYTRCPVIGYKFHK